MNFVKLNGSIISLLSELNAEVSSMQSNISSYKKTDNSPVTEADLFVNNQLCKFIKKYSPIQNIISEENKQILYKDREKWSDFWIIDPIDGTKEYLKGNDDYTINICLYKDNQPFLSYVSVPNNSVIYNAKKGRGAFKNKIKIECSDINESYFSVVASKSHFDSNTEKFIDRLQLTKEVKLLNAGSSLKICYVAEGLADVYPRFGPTMEWDTAAADFILQESGGKMISVDSKTKLEYNKKILRNPFFIAASNIFRKKYLDSII